MRSLGTAAVLAVLGSVGLAHGQQILQQGFEGRDVYWFAAGKDATYEERAHRLADARKSDLTDEHVHGGTRAEFIHIAAGPGSYVHYAFPLGKGPILDELKISLFVRSDRPGVQLFARAVLPRERDPSNPGQPLTVLLPGEVYQTVNRWQALAIVDPQRLLREQSRLVRARLKRDVVADGAYVDQLLVNVYTGPGETKVWLDDLEAGPLTEEPLSPASRGAPGRTVARQAAEVQLNGGQLLISKERFFMLGIRHTGTPLHVLKRAGFNTLWLDETTPQGLLEDAVDKGFWIVPTLPTPGSQDRYAGKIAGQLTSREREEFGGKLTRFLSTDAVLAWDLGGNLSYEHSPFIARSAQLYRSSDVARPVVCDVSDGYRSYTASLDGIMLGAHRWPLLTGLELPAYRDWLMQRRRVVPAQTYSWTWIQTHLPDWFTNLAYERGSATRFDEPIGPQPEQIRLLAYTAVGCGYRGLGFWSDRFLADSHTGRDRLLALGLLNMELQMLEPLLVGQKDAPEWIDTSHKEIKAAVLRTDKGTLVLPIWMGNGAQFVPGHAAVPSLSITVPRVQANCQAWEVSPGRLRSYRCERVLGGTNVTLHDFNLTAALVFTSDLSQTGLIVRFQEQQRRVRKLATQWAHDLAEEELAKALFVQNELEKLGQGIPDGDALAEQARKWLDRCATYRRNGEQAEAWTAAQVALQVVRLLTRAHWDQARRSVDMAVSSPYLVSYFTLPRHYRFAEEVRRLQPAANAIPEGNFETPSQEVPADQAPPKWLIQKEATLDDVEVTAKRVTELPHSGKQCLMLNVGPRPGMYVPPVLERTFIAVHTPAVRLEPGTLVKISVFVRVPAQITGSADGVLIFDSSGGEPLAVRFTAAVPVWKQHVLYRRVPSSGSINVTLALTGVGTAYFDDVTIEPLVPREQPGAAPVRSTSALP